MLPQYKKKYKKKFQLIKSLVKKENPIIVEIGAHYGEDTMRFSETFKDPLIYCFEADPRNICIIRKHIGNRNIKLFEYAVSNSDNERVKFYQSYIPSELDEVPSKYGWIEKDDYNSLKLSGSGASSLKKGYHGAFNEIDVEVIRFDTWMGKEGLSVVDFLWIDVQGAEKAVIEGLSGVASKINYIWIEYGESEYDDYMGREATINMLTQRNFSLIEKHSSTGKKGDLLFKRK